MCVFLIYCNNVTVNHVLFKSSNIRELYLMNVRTLKIQVRLGPNSCRIFSSSQNEISLLETTILMNIQLGVIRANLVDFLKPGHNCNVMLIVDWSM